jgi:CO/xanthine dehydrogenase FAD-binding subunit
LQEFEYRRPETLEDALKVIDEHGKAAKILAGGTDIIIALKDKMISCKCVVDIKAIKELQNIEYSENDGLSIGAAVCLNDVINSVVVGEKYHIRVDAAKTLANSLLRNRATLVGNICNSSPGGDMLPASLVLDGEVHAHSVNGMRIIPLKDFFSGVKKNVLLPNEMVTKVAFPRKTGEGKYLKKSRIKGHDLAQVSAAGFLSRTGELKFALGAVGPTPILVEDFENYAKGNIGKDKEKIISTVMNKVNPISDQRATKSFRLAMVEYLTGKIIEELEEGQIA